MAKIKTQISEDESRAIQSYYDRVYGDLGFAGRASPSNVTSAKKAFKNEKTAPFIEVFKNHDIKELGNRFIDGSKTFLNQMVIINPPEFPKKLKKATENYKRLQRKFTKLTNKVHENPTPARIAKANRAYEKLEQFKKVTLVPTRNVFDNEIKDFIDQNNIYQQLKSDDRAIKSIMNENIYTVSPVVYSMRIWGYNMLLRRSRSVAGVEP